MKSLFIFIFLFSSFSLAQFILPPETTQSSASLQWWSIENKRVKVIYPDFLSKEALYVANLVEHYSEHVGSSYGILNPKPFTLILRPEMADPNGFVTLAPRRSEWFSSSAFQNYIGSLEWNQILSIHEYRHIIQYDHFDQGSVTILRYLLGDMGQQLGLFLGLQPWYFEGDAVWAETKYSDAGRGRSPAFMARLKALLTSERTPTYDEFVNGTYNTKLPNHYVYGYVLVSSATKKFGDDFWKKVTQRIANLPHPRKLYTAFEEVADQSFEDFYNETMEDLKKRWAHERTSLNTQNEKAAIPGDYRENLYPFKTSQGLYYLNSTLDSHWTLFKKSENSAEEIFSLPFFPDINQIHISGGYAVYTQFIPDSRYGYKGSSNLVLIDLKNTERSQISEGRRYYNPRLNARADKIIATEFTDQNKWALTELNLEGHELRKILIKDHLIAEAYPLNDQEVVAILADLNGNKSIDLIDWQKGLVRNLLPASRNNLYALHVDTERNVFFEAQSQGQINIFKTNLEGDFSQCTHSSLAAKSPSVYEGMLYYSNQDGSGSTLAKTLVRECQPIKKDILIDFNYLSPNSPSDHYNAFPLKKFPEQAQLRTLNENRYSPEEYGDWDRQLFIPHSWSFFGGTGLQLSGKSDNFLRTLSLTGTIGQEGGSNTNYSEIKMDIKKYTPIFSVNAGIRNRSAKIFNSPLHIDWKESISGLTASLPYLYRHNLFTHSAILSLGGSHVDTKDYEINESALNSGADRFLIGSAQFSYIAAKDKVHRSILSPWGFSYIAKYDQAESQNADRRSSYRFFNQATGQMPGLGLHHGFKLIFEQEKQGVSLSDYRFLPVATSPIDSVFSRGYNYEIVEDYSKISANYILPLLYPDLNLWGFYYLKQITTNAFFDTTLLRSSLKQATYDSYGVELEFESKILRILPIHLGARYIHKVVGNENLVESYTHFNFGF